MSSRSWPAWHPENILRASDLLGLEDYLLARSSLAEGLEGVTNLGRDSVTGEDDGGSLVLSVVRLRGLTPKGQPVILDDDLSLRYMVGDAAEDWLLDVSVMVNLAADSSFEKPDKLSLWVTPAADPAEPFASSRQELYLGRYVWDAAAERLDILTRPTVTHLRALKETEGWEQWTAPLRDKLAGLICYLEDDETNTSERKAAALQLAYQIGFGWPHLPVPRLAYNLQLLRWLLVNSAPLVADSDTLEALPASPSGEDLPSLLAVYIQLDDIGLHGQELRPGKEVEVTFEPRGERVVYTLLQGLSHGRFELHLRENDSGDSDRPPVLRWLFTSDDGVPIVKTKDEDPEPGEGGVLYFMHPPRIPQTGYQLIVSGISPETFARTRLFFVEATD